LPGRATTSTEIQPGGDKAQEAKMKRLKYCIIPESERPKENFLFEKVNGDWTMKGQYVSGKAKRITVGRLQGVAAMSDCAGRNSECYAAFLTNGNRTVSFETSGTASIAIVRDLMLRTLKFL
jgi:hypothetical protein